VVGVEGRRRRRGEGGESKVSELSE